MRRYSATTSSQTALSSNESIQDLISSLGTHALGNTISTLTTSTAVAARILRQRRFRVAPLCEDDITGSPRSISLTSARSPPQARLSEGDGAVTNEVE